MRTVGLTVLHQAVRPEIERQELIRELQRLRRAGLNVDRQEAIVSELRLGWELGWP